MEFELFGLPDYMILGVLERLEDNDLFNLCTSSKHLRDLCKSRGDLHAKMRKMFTPAYKAMKEYRTRAIQRGTLQRDLEFLKKVREEGLYVNVKTRRRVIKRDSNLEKYYFYENGLARFRFHYISKSPWF